MKSRAVRTDPTSPSFPRTIALIALAIGATTGCTREFYRQWANQDVSEAVFEKSRDPRWRLDVFSIEPPAMSRFADPYDPDTPPAPPDDFATQALSPVPQWPSQRLLLPVEGTGYLEHARLRAAVHGAAAAGHDPVGDGVSPRRSPTAGPSPRRRRSRRRGVRRRSCPARRGIPGRGAAGRRLIPYRAPRP